MTADAAAMSARDLRAWLTEAGPALAGLGIDAVHGAGPRLVEDGSTWVSFSSRWGTGRLVRASDGSSRSTAHRHRDGVTVIDERAASTTEEQLASLTRALGRPIER